MFSIDVTRYPGQRAVSARYTSQEINCLFPKQRKIVTIEFNSTSTANFYMAEDLGPCADFKIQSKESWKIRELTNLRVGTSQRVFLRNEILKSIFEYGGPNGDC